MFIIVPIRYHLSTPHCQKHYNALADPEIYFGGPNQGPQSKIRAKPDSRARSARELRAKPEPKAKPENKRGRGLGRGLGDGEPLPINFLKNQTWNHLFWCIFEAIILND